MDCVVRCKGGRRMVQDEGRRRLQWMMQRRVTTTSFRGFNCTSNSVRNHPGRGPHGAGFGGPGVLELLAGDGVSEASELVANLEDTILIMRGCKESEGTGMGTGRGTRGRDALSGTTRLICP